MFWNKFSVSSQNYLNLCFKPTTKMEGMSAEKIVVLCFFISVMIGVIIFRCCWADFVRIFRLPPRLFSKYKISVAIVQLLPEFLLNINQNWDCYWNFLSKSIILIKSLSSSPKDSKYRKSIGHVVLLMKLCVWTSLRL